MPCRDDYVDDGYAREAAESGRVACELAKVLREYPQTWRKAKHSLSAATLAWIERHDEEDRQRELQEEQEKARKRIAKDAKAKLTPREREVLGIR
jgi:DNA-directed RNA polymerase specialized sigma subunit